MATAKSQGLILQRIAFGDTSLILKAYTAEYGLLTFMAKGARQPRSKFRAASDFFLLIQFVHPVSFRGEMATLLDASLVDDMPELRSMPLKQALGQVWLETYLRLSPPGGESQQRFDWLTQHLQSLEASQHRVDAAALALDFWLGFCALSGFAPQFRTCVHCGSEVAASRLRMHLDMGGPWCRRCLGEGGETLPLPWESARLLERLAENGIADLAFRNAPRTVTQAAETFLLAFIARHAGEGRRLKSLDIYHALAGENWADGATHGR